MPSKRYLQFLYQKVRPAHKTLFEILPLCILKASFGHSGLVPIQGLAYLKEETNLNREAHEEREPFDDGGDSAVVQA